VTERERKQKKRLAALKSEAEEHPTVNIAKRYKLTEKAVDLIAAAGETHGQQSRALQVAAELAYWNAPLGDDSLWQHVLDSKLTGKTYRLPERTVTLIAGMVPSFGTLGNVMAYLAFVLTQIEKPPDLTPRATKKEKRDARSLCWAKLD
jgi:hypothetical protein